MGWTAPFYSSFGSDFNSNFHDRVYHSYSSYARGDDILLGTVNYLDVTPLGRQEDGGVMNWVRHHDTYADNGMI